jgi:PLD-like domain
VRTTGSARRRPVLRTCVAVSAVLVTALASASVPRGRSSAVAATPQPPATVSSPSVEVGFDRPGQSDPTGGIRNAEFDLVTDAASGSVLMVNVFRITDNSLARALIQAGQRGVHVEVLLDGGNRTDSCHGVRGCVNQVFTALEQLNSIRPSDSRTWLKTCDGGDPANSETATGTGNGCVGQGLDHNKFLLASSSEDPQGQAVTDAVLQVSTNSTGGQYRHAWNDSLLISGRPTLYQDYLRYFNRMVTASASTAPTSSMYFTNHDGDTVDTTTISQHDIETWSFPRSPSDDPVAAVLGQIPVTDRCRNKIGSGAPGPAHSQIYAAIAFISGRPLLIRRLAALQQSGCLVQIIYSTISAKDRSALTNAGVQLWQACTPADARNQDTAQFLHSKFFLIAGSQRSVGENRRIVYTGSENWNTQSLSGADNRMLQYVEAANDTQTGHVAARSPVYDAYIQRWRSIQKQIETNGQPTANTCAAATDY